MVKLSQVKKGSVLLEIIIALGLFMIIIPAVLYLASTSYIGNLKNEDNLKALAFAREGMEACASIRDYSWDNLTDGTHGLTSLNGFWEFSGSEDTNGKFTRSIEVLAIDTEKKSITLTVSWDTFEGSSNSLTLNSELSQWQTYSPEVPSCEEFPCGGTKVYMCHGGGSTICVGAPARLSHWAHGDGCGPCP